MQPGEVIDRLYTLPLTTQMRVAANVLAATTGRLFESKDLNATDDEKRDRKWSAGTLRVKAHEWEREDRLAAEAEAKRLKEQALAIKQLSNDLYKTLTPRGKYHPDPDLLTLAATQLVVAGWTKKASE